MADVALALHTDGRPRGGVVKLEDYERTLRPELSKHYERGGFCCVVTGSTQYGRAYADPRRCRRRSRYYDELKRRGEVVYRFSPTAGRNDPVLFDYSFNYYPLTYDRPGPEIVIYGCMAARGSSAPHIAITGDGRRSWEPEHR